jgi:excisionase family DNA binding protein
MASLARELELNGYLPLSKFCAWLRESHPHVAMSYPTALNLVRQNKLRAIRVGKMIRISRAEAERWVREGNYLPEQSENPKDFQQLI